MSQLNEPISTELIEIPINPHHIAIVNPESTCFNCLQEFPQLHTIHISALNHGSKFTNFSSRLYLCQDCLNLTNPIWWNLEIVKTYTEYNLMQLNYKYEQEILDFINNMPLSGQELFYARLSKGIKCDIMRGQDWIDYSLDKLPHEKCNEYGYYSPEERKAYYERFYICNKVRIVIDNKDDYYKESRCPFGVFGNEDGTSECHKPHHQCYECKMFEARDSESRIEVMAKVDFEIFELENELVLKKMLRDIKNKNKKVEIN